ncbi:MAG: hypothetical protein ACFFDI_21420 [Promethearchaeota archaeon]
MLKLNSVTVSKISTLADKSLRIVLDTMELSPDQMTALFEAYKEGEEGVEIEEIKVKGLKSKSQQLRNVLYRLWEQSATTMTDKEYYDSYMDKLINSLKEKLQ